jgi:hypothetical protein
MNRLHKSQVERATTQRSECVNLDCTKCGACCFGLAVYLTPREAKFFQANRKLKLLIKPQDESVCMRRTVKESRCFALQGKPGCCTCKVYDDRPRICKEFEPGSDACIRARKQFHIQKEVGPRGDEI